MWAYFGILGDHMECFINGKPLRLSDSFSAAFDRPCPEGSLTLCKETKDLSCFIEIGPAAGVPCFDEKTLIDSIHAALGERQGLIEVRGGITPMGRQFIYSITKTGKGPHGTDYELLADFEIEGVYIHLKGEFIGTDTEGERETLIYSLANRLNDIDVSSYNWFQDPYDPKLVKGLRMTMAEEAQFDEYFPEHPLTQARELAAYLIRNN